MAKVKTYDVVVIGAGSAGFSAAEVARSQGASVCMIEKGKLGGECPNWACVPTKALLKSARMYHLAKHKLQDYGVHTGKVTYTFEHIVARKDAVVNAVTGNGKRMARVAGDLGITVMKGSAKFLDAHTIKVGSNKVKGKKIIIATGTTSFVPPISGLKQAGYLDFKDVVSLKRLPASVVIVGGGPVACEFATFFSMLEVKTTMIELGSHLLGREDAEIAAIAEKALRSYGVDIRTGAKTLSIKKEGKKKKVTYQVGEEPRRSIMVEAIIVATGKRANVLDLNLKKAGVKLDDKGRLVLSETLQTSVKHIFAAGDVAGGMQFTHTAHNEGYIVGVNVMKKTARGMLKRDERVVPRVTFVEPEVASVGITGEQAVKEKKSVMIAKFPVGALGRAVTEGEREGLIKIVVDKKTRQVLGGHMIGARAGEVIHEIALAMYANLKIDDLANMTHAYPTYSEVIVAAAGQV